MSLKGVPDWSQALTAGGDDLYFAYEEPRRLYAPPLDLRVVDEGPLGPAWVLELIRLQGGPAPTVLGLLTIRFAGHHALAERQAAVFAEYPDARLEPLAPRHGFLRFQAAEAIGVPADLVAPQPLVWSGAGSLTFAAQLEAAGVALMEEALAGGLSLVTATAEVEAWGVGARTRAVVEFDPAALAGLIREAEGDAGQCTAAALRSRLADPAAAAAFVLEGPDADADRLQAITALAERLIGRFARLTPSRDPGAGPAYAFDLDRMVPGRLRWDLAEPVLTPRAWVLDSNPLDAAHRALAEGFPLRRETPVVQFAAGLHVLSVYPNLPARRVGALMLGVELRVPPRPPDRPQTVARSASFREGETTKTLSFRLAPDEPVAFEYQAFAFMMEEGGARRLAGLWRRHEGVHLTVPPDSFPVRFVRVEASPGLLRMGTIRLRAAGRTETGPWSVETEMTPAVPALAIAVPPDLADGVLHVTATALDGGGEAALEPRPLEDCWLDLSTFPSAGPQRLDVACEFDDDAAVAAIECAPEDRLETPDAWGLVRLTPQAPAREWRWLAANPFRPGYRWRWRAHPDEPPAPWSDVRRPEDGVLTLRSSARAAVSAQAAGGGR